MNIGLQVIGTFRRHTFKTRLNMYLNRSCSKGIFNEYWATGDWNIQTAYIQNQTKLLEVKSRHSNNVSKQKSFSRSYIVTVENYQISVCKTSFAHIQGISEARVYHAQ